MSVQSSCDQLTAVSDLELRRSMWRFIKGLKFSQFSYCCTFSIVVRYGPEIAENCEDNLTQIIRTNK